MAENSITIDKSLVKALDKADKKVRNQLLRRGMRSAMKIVLRKSKELVPVESGALKRSLAVRAGKRSRNTISVLVTTKEGMFAGDTFYGGFQEYGFRLGKRASNADLGVRKGKRRTLAQRSAIGSMDDSRRQIPAQPYLRPALDNNKAAITAEMTNEIERGLKEQKA